VKTAYYPGCSLDGTSREFGESLLAVVRALGSDLQEIDDWNCCGASSAHAVDHTLSVALPARNLALAEAQGFDEVIAPCAACYNRLANARQEVAADRSVAARISDVIGRPLDARTPVRNVIELLARLGPEITPRITNPLKGLRVACYYGCLLVRPSRVTGFDDAEQPRSMEALAKLVGATPVPWNMAVECCGGSFSICRTGSVIRLGRAILDDARKAGAQAIVVACPMCHSNLDFRQASMGVNGAAMPIVFVTELIGLALGLQPKALGLHRHFVDATGVGAPAPRPAPATAASSTVEAR
jgi:heterodisulfide reductase subunit B2